MPDRHAVLIGATGLIGRHVLDRLLDDPRWTRVTVLARRKAALTHAKLDWRQTEFVEPADQSLGADVTDFFDCMGTTIKQAGSRDAFRRVDLEIPLALARAARRLGATHASVISSLGADPQSRVFYSRIKGEVEAGLRDLAFPSLHILQPSLLVGERQTARAGERVAEVALAAFRPLLVGGLRKYRAIAGADVARAMITLAGNPQSGVRVFVSDELARLAAA